MSQLSANPDSALRRGDIALPTDPYVLSVQCGTAGALSLALPPVLQHNRSPQPQCNPLSFYRNLPKFACFCRRVLY